MSLDIFLNTVAVVSFVDDSSVLNILLSKYLKDKNKTREKKITKFLPVYVNKTSLNLIVISYS